MSSSTIFSSILKHDFAILFCQWKPLKIVLCFSVVYISRKPQERGEIRQFFLNCYNTAHIAIFFEVPSCPSCWLAQRLQTAPNSMPNNEKTASGSAESYPLFPNSWAQLLNRLHRRVVYHCSHEVPLRGVEPRLMKKFSLNFIFHAKKQLVVLSFYLRMSNKHSSE